MLLLVGGRLLFLVAHLGQNSTRTRTNTNPNGTEANSNARALRKQSKFGMIQEGPNPLWTATIAASAILRTSYDLRQIRHGPCLDLSHKDPPVRLTRSQLARSRLGQATNLSMICI